MPVPDQTSVKIALIEDQREIRDGLAILINGTSGFRITGAFGSIESALSDMGGERPEIMLVDISLPGMSGIEGIPLLRERHPQCIILVLSVHDDDDRIFSALCAGASGYLLKKTPPARLIESLHDVLSGGAPMSPEVARRVVKLFREFKPPDTASYHLTPQETELLKLLIEGHYKKTAAREMGISTNTVSFHLKNIYTKLQVHSKTEAVTKALRERLV